MMVDQTHLSSFYFLACMLSSIFSVLYLGSDFATIAMDNNNEGSRTDQGLFADLVFWCFLAAQTFVSLGISTQHTACIEQLYLRFLLRFCSFYVICSPSRDKGNTIGNIVSSLAFVIFMGQTMLDAMVLICTEPILVVSYLHRFLELILLVGHRWDGEPSLEVVLNCRLFYVTWAGALLHADVMLSFFSSYS